MKYGHYSDYDLRTHEQWPFRCPSWTPMPDGKKNVVILGCSHTWGVGLEPHETWVHDVSKHNTERLRYWNLGQPGAGADSVVRILYSCQKVINPNIILVCWPEISRRERMENIPLDWDGKHLPTNVLGSDKRLRYETNQTDFNNFYKNLFFLEKFAENHGCKTFHTFADTVIDIKQWNKSLNVIEDYTLRNCWPYWDKFTARKLNTQPSKARDGKHYGEENHKRFAQIVLERFSAKLK